LQRPDTPQGRRNLLAPPARPAPGPAGRPIRGSHRLRSKRPFRPARGTIAMMRVDRRSFLRALGGAGFAFGLGASSGSAAGAAAPSGRPLRLLCIYTPHGRAHELWQPRQGFDLSFEDAILQPFDDPTRHGRSFKDKLIVLDGVDLSAGIAVGTVG